MEPTGKPIDRWLGLGGIAVGIILFLLPKTPLVVIGVTLVMFALLIHPIWHFWWIGERLWRKVTATLILIVGLVYLGKTAWPPIDVQEGSTIPQNGVCYAILLGQGNDPQNVPVMIDNPTPYPVDNVTMRFIREPPDSRGELEGSLDVGTCRARTSTGSYSPPFFLHPGIHTRMRYIIFILTRYGEVTEHLNLWQSSKANIYCQEVQLFGNNDQLIYEDHSFTCDRPMPQ